MGGDGIVFGLRIGSSRCGFCVEDIELWGVFIGFLRGDEML